MVFANSSAILTDAFPHDQRGLALGVNSVAAVVGSFIGLVLGGVLAPIQWRLVFVVSVPIGLVRDDLVVPLAARARRSAGPARIDWWGNAHVRARPRRADDRHHVRDPAVRRAHDGVDVAVRARAAARRHRAARALLLRSSCTCDEPMFQLELFRIRAFAAGNLAALLAAMGARRPPVHPDHLAAGDLAARARLRLRADAALGGHLHAAADRSASSIAGPASGWLSDRFGARPFATGGMLVAATELRAPDRAAGRTSLRLSSRSSCC